MGLAPDVRASIRWIADDFDVLADGAGEPELDAPSSGTRWTNRELLFHMWFGQRITRALLPLVGGFSRVPPSASRGYARLLTAASSPYEWVNYAASAHAPRVVSLERTQRWMRADTIAILRWSDQATDNLLDRGMHFPADWDPYFQSWMSRRDVLEWAPKHYRHHRAQLTISATR